MKKILLTTVMAFGAVASSVSAQQMIAGWDFRNTPSGNWGDFQVANWGLQGNKEYSNGTGKATLYVDGTNGSSDLLESGTPPMSFSVGEKGSQVGTDLGKDFLAPPQRPHSQITQFDVTPSSRALTFYGESVGGNSSTSINGKYISINFATSGFQDITFQYASKNGGALAPDQIQWEYSVDGSSWSTLGPVDSLTTEWDLSTYDLSGLTEINNMADVWFRFEINGAQAGKTIEQYIALDNIQIVGAAIPEPSTYAAIFGVLALLLAVRRRQALKQD